MNRIRLATLVVVPALIAAVMAPPAFAAGPYLKLKAGKEAVAANEPVTVTLTAVSTRTMSLPAATVSVDEGQGFRERTDLFCAGEASTAKEITPDKASVSTCELKIAHPGKAKVRFEYRLSSGVVRSNAVTLDVREAGSERAAQ